MDETWQEQQEQEQDDSEMMHYYQVEQQHEYEALNGNPAPIKPGLLGE